MSAADASGLTPWVGALFRSLRVKPLAAALALATAVAGPVLMYDHAVTRAAGNDSLIAGLATCPADVGLDVIRYVAVPGVPADPNVAPAPRQTIGAVTAALDRAVGSYAHTRIITLLGGTVTLRDPATSKTVPVQLVSRTDAGAHVQRLQSSAASTGLVVQSLSLPPLGMTKPGPAEIVARKVTVPIAIDSVVTDLDTGYDSSYWCPLNPLIYGRAGVNETPIAIVDQAVMLSILAATGENAVVADWEYPPDATTWTMTTAPATLARFAAIATDARNPEGSLAPQIGIGKAVQSDQTGILAAARRQMSAANGAVRPFTMGSLVVIFAAIGVCAACWLSIGRGGRRTLVRHGVGIPGIMLKSMLEMMLPIVVGGGLGVLGSWLVERRVNPREASAWTDGIASRQIVAIGILLPLIAAACAALVDAIALVRPRRESRRWLFPTAMFGLVVAAAMTVYSFRLRLRASRQHHAFLGVDTLSVLAPVCVAAVLVVVLVRIVLSRRAARIVDRAPATIWLAWRRICGERGSVWAPLSCIVVAAALVHLASANAAAIGDARTDRTTLQLGAHTVYVLDSSSSGTRTATLAESATLVSRLHESSALAQGKPPVDVIAVDPATFAHDAFWRGRFDDSSLAGLLSKLSSTDMTAALVIGNDVPDRFRIVLPGDDTNVTLALHAVARPNYFPGEDATNSKPLVIVNRSLLLTNKIIAGPELWSASTTTMSNQDLAAAGFLVTQVEHAADVPLDGAIAVADALRAAERIAAAGLFAGLAACAAWAAARRRGSRRERALLQTIGLSRGRVVLGSVVEVGLGGALVIVVGAVVGESVNRLMPAFSDQSPFNRPSAVAVTTFGPILIEAALAVLVMIAVALGVRHRARAANPFAEVSSYD